MAEEGGAACKEDSVLLQRTHSSDVVHNHFSSVIFNTATALLGASMFSLPWAFQQAGVLGGSVVLMLVALVAGETARMLLMAQRAIFERSGKVLRYPEIAAEILGHENWAHFVRTATIVSCIGGCCGYMIFLGQVVCTVPSTSYIQCVITVLEPGIGAAALSVLLHGGVWPRPASRAGIVGPLLPRALVLHNYRRLRDRVLRPGYSLRRISPAGPRAVRFFGCRAVRHERRFPVRRSRHFHLHYSLLCPFYGRRSAAQHPVCVYGEST